jgi:hypothetical protein
MRRDRVRFPIAGTISCLFGVMFTLANGDTVDLWTRNGGGPTVQAFVAPLS